LDLSFLEVPSTLSDHVRSGLLWFPKIALLGLIALVNELFTQRIEGGRTEEEIIAESSDPEKVRKMRRRPFPYVAGASLIPLLGYILIGEYFLLGLPLALMVAWVLFATWTQSPDRTQARRSRGLRNLIVFAPPVMFFLFTAGHIEAARLSEEGAPVSMLSKSDGTTEPVVIFRNFDRGLLLKQQTGKIKFIPWSDTKGVELPGTYKKASGILCSHLPAACAMNSSPAASAK
jgi:hypothetical protein